MNKKEPEEQVETYSYPAIGGERKAIRATRAAKADERSFWEAKGYTYCERRVNEREIAYWFEPNAWQVHR